MPSSIDFDSIPEEIKKHPNWIMWKLEEKKNKAGEVEIDPKTGKTKKTKVPRQVNGKFAKSNDPKTWSSFETVKETFLKSKGRYSGIGYVFDSNYGIIGIDYDNVYDPEKGEWTDQEALKDILYMGSYAEYSQSRKGIHVLVKGCLPEDPTNAKRQGRRKNNREMYKGPQYFAFTGLKIEEVPKEIKENQEAINELFKKYYPEKEPQDNKKASNPNPIKILRSPPLTDEEVLEKCRKDKRHQKFFKLYDLGEWNSFKEYPSKSEASLALCVYFAFYTQDPEQVNRIYCKGKLYSSDWDRDSKGLATIKTAISGLTTVWNPKEYKKNKQNCLYPYTLTPEGVGKFIDIKDPEDPSKTITIVQNFIFTPVKITALSDDLDGEKIIYKISIDHPVNGHIEIWKDQGDLLTRSGINKLLSEGLIASDSSYRDITGYFVKDILRAAAEDQKELIAHYTGWKRDKTIFVSGKEAYTHEGVIPVNLTNPDIANAFRKSGTLDGWINGCMWILKYPCTRINCYTTLSAIVAGYLEQPSPILQNQGITTSGKTLKAAAAVSIIGDPSELVKSADTTLTAAERHAIASSGTCTVYDEIGLLKNPDGLTYLLSNGRKKNRGTKEGLEATGHWFKSFILNGEFEFLKESAAQGEIGRLIECSWKLPTDAVNAKSTEVEIKEHFGQILPLFMQKFFSQINTIKEKYSKLCSKLPDSAVDVGSRLKDSFALIIIAGEILEEVFEDIGIEKKDPYPICEELYIENIGSDRVHPYWIRGLKIINDELNVCKQIYGSEGEWTDCFAYKGQLGGIRELDGVFIDILPATFNDICDKHGLKHMQLIREWREHKITEVDKIDNRGKQTNQKTVKIDGDPKKVIRLIKSKVFETLGIKTLDTTERAILIEHIEKHWPDFNSSDEEKSKGFAQSFADKFPIHKKHTGETILQLLKEILAESNI